MTNECKKCDYKSKWCSSLRDHVKAVHEGIVYECEKCDYSAKSKPSIREHKKAVHEGVLHNTFHHPTASPTNQSGAAVLIVGIWPLMNTWHEDSNTFQHASKLSLPPPNDKEFKLGGGNDLLSGKIRNLIFFLLITSFLMMPSVTGAINNNQRERPQLHNQEQLLIIVGIWPLRNTWHFSFGTAATIGQNYHPRIYGEYLIWYIKMG